MPAWALTLAGRYCEISRNCNEEDISGNHRDSEPLFVAYGGEPIARFQFRDVFRCPAANAANTKSSLCGASLKRSCLEPLPDGSLAGIFRRQVRGKVVLIGGAYRAARDTYETPLGLLPGVAINGYVVRSQIQGNFLHEQNRPAVIVLDLGAGCALVLIVFSRRIWPDWTVLRIAAVVLLVTIVAGVASLGLQYIAGCGALLLGMMIHLIEHGHHEEAEHRKEKFYILIQRRLRLWIRIPHRAQTRRRHHSAP
jgi:hypothetical protein